MNETFREHVTGAAFAIQLSRRQCWELLSIAEGAPSYRFNMTTLHALCDRGLVSWGPQGDKPHTFKGLTRAGELMVSLLREAGLTAENTMPKRYREAA